VSYPLAGAYILHAAEIDHTALVRHDGNRHVPAVLVCLRLGSFGRLLGLFERYTRGAVGWQQQRRGWLLCRCPGGENQHRAESKRDRSPRTHQKSAPSVVI
jgi:hypothetical protein